MRRQSSETEPGSLMQGTVGHIGRSIRIKGTVRGKEDLLIEGQVDGVVELLEHHLLLEGPARTQAKLRAKYATIRGRHRGNTEAGEKVEITAQGVVIGDVRTPRLVIQEGAKFRGRIDMDVPLPPDLDEPTGGKSNGRSQAKGEGKNGASKPDGAVETKAESKAEGKKDEGKKKGRTPE